MKLTDTFLENGEPFHIVYEMKLKRDKDFKYDNWNLSRYLIKKRKKGENDHYVVGPLKWESFLPYVTVA